MFAAKTKAGNQRLVPANECILIFPGQAKHVGNNANRHLAGILADQFNLAVAFERGDHLFANLLDHGQKIPQPRAHELPRHDIAQPAMRGAVAVFEYVRAEYVG